MLVKSAGQPLARQLAQRLAQRIRDRLLPPGARLPSVRQCAQQQGVSPATVVAAYDSLLAQGLIEAVKYRGFYVKNSAIRHAVIALEAPENRAFDAPDPDSGEALRRPSFTPQHLPVNATALMRGMFHAQGQLPQPGMGAFPPEWLEAPFLNAAVRQVCTPAQLAQASLRYGEPAGDPALRRALARRLQALSVPAEPEQILTTVGATHALDIISRTLLRPGDAVLVEEPGWAIEFARLAALGMRVLPVPRGPEGPDLDVLAGYCAQHRPRLMVSVSVLHNPTGYGLSPARAHRVLQLAQQYDFHIVEDDTYSHLAPDAAPRMAALDGLQRTLIVGGFSKILAPGWRVGFLAAPTALTERLLDTKLLTTLTTPSLLEQALALCMEQGALRRHAERMRARLGQARARSVELARAAGVRFVAPPNGLFGWVDTGVDTERLAQRLLDLGYLIAPGALFQSEHAPSTCMRINFCTTQDAAFWHTYRQIRTEFGVDGSGLRP
ncbi:MAG: PLP-dependent aminotransferase family protein [Rhodoferax sp.]